MRFRKLLTILVVPLTLTTVACNQAKEEPTPVVDRVDEGEVLFDLTKPLTPKLLFETVWDNKITSLTISWEVKGITVGDIQINYALKCVKHKDFYEVYYAGATYITLEKYEGKVKLNKTLIDINGEWRVDCDRVEFEYELPSEYLNLSSN